MNQARGLMAVAWHPRRIGSKGMALATGEGVQHAGRGDIVNP